MQNMEQQECKYGAGCLRPGCRYKHNVKKVNIPCIHFANKGCLKGDKCPFLHVTNSATQQAQVNKPVEEIKESLTPRSPIVQPSASIAPKSPIKSVTPPRSPLIEPKLVNLELQ